MTFYGRFQNGVVVFDESVRIAEGASVIVETLPTRTVSKSVGESELPLGKQLLRFSGVMKDTPSDLAQNHDRYIIEGVPRK